MKLTWEDFDDGAFEIAKYYRSKGIKKIVGIQRGGLPLAVKLSNTMRLPMEVLNYQTRDGIPDINGAFEFIKTLGNLNEVLFVDDICDSGRTIGELRQLSKALRFSTLITRDSSLVEFTPQHRGFDGDWVTFPWEV